MICPCCSSELKPKNNNQVFIWTCLNCPIVVFEYYDNKDIEGLKKELNKSLVKKTYSELCRVYKKFSIVNKYCK